MPEPEGVAWHQLASLVVVHEVLDETLKVVIPAGSVTVRVAGVTFSMADGPDCVTVTIIGTIPVEPTVMLAVRFEAKVFSENEATIVPLPLPEVVTVHHGELLVAVHGILELTMKLTVPAERLTF